MSFKNLMENMLAVDKMEDREKFQRQLSSMHDQLTKKDHQLEQKDAQLAQKDAEVKV